MIAVTKQAMFIRTGCHSNPNGCAVKPVVRHSHTSCNNLLLWWVIAAMLPSCSFKIGVEASLTTCNKVLSALCTHMQTDRQTDRIHKAAIAH